MYQINNGTAFAGELVCAYVGQVFEAYSGSGQLNPEMALALAFAFPFGLGFAFAARFAAGSASLSSEEVRAKRPRLPMALGAFGAISQTQSGI